MTNKVLTIPVIKFLYKTVKKDIKVKKYSTIRKYMSDEEWSKTQEQLKTLNIK